MLISVQVVEAVRHTFTTFYTQYVLNTIDFMYNQYIIVAFRSQLLNFIKQYFLMREKTTQPWFIYF